MLYKNNTGQTLGLATLEWKTVYPLAKHDLYVLDDCFQY